MTDISPQAAEQPRQIQAEAAENPLFRAKKGDKKGALGVFAKLLAGLRKNLNAPEGAQKAESGKAEGKAGAKKGDRLAALSPQSLAVPGKSGEKLAALKKGGSPAAEAADGLSAQAGKTAKNGRKSGENLPELGMAIPGQESHHQFDYQLKNDDEKGGGSGKAGKTPAPADALKADDARSRKPKVEAPACAGRRGAEPEAGDAAQKNAALFGAKANIANEAKQAANDAKHAKAGKAEESRRKKIEVTDLRSEGAEIPANAAEAVSAEKAVNEAETVFDVRPLSEAAGGHGFAGEGFGSEKAGQEGASRYEAMLSQQLQGGLSNDIVRQAAIVLKDGNEGTIRLSLRPESLGKVKVTLEMAENKIAGHILVDTEEALRAFEKEIHALEQAFRDSGWENATLDTALNSGAGQDGGEPRQPFSQQFAASRYEAAADTVEAESIFAGRGSSVVNLLV